MNSLIPSMPFRFVKLPQPGLLPVAVMNAVNFIPFTVPAGIATVRYASITAMSNGLISG
jgi:hypothetical protein